jgi:hypothetical protein
MMKQEFIEDIRIIGLINIEYLLQDKTYNTGDNIKISNFKNAFYNKYFKKNNHKY